MVKVERCDIAGQRLDLTAAVQPVANSPGLKVRVPIRDNAQSPAHDWNQKANSARTFYIVLHLRANDGP